MNAYPSLPCRASVVKRYEAAYPAPLTLDKGNEVMVLPSPMEGFPDWRWCEADNGERRWFPLAYLTVTGSRASLNRAYESTELTVAPGDQLTVKEIVAGWAWCINSEGRRGWVPIENIRL